MQKWIIYDKVNGVSIFRNIIPVAPIFDVTYVSYISIDLRGSRFADKLPTISETNVCPRTKRFVRLIAKSRFGYHRYPKRSAWSRPALFLRII